MKHLKFVRFYSNFIFFNVKNCKGYTLFDRMEKDAIFLLGIGCSGKTSLIVTCLGEEVIYEPTISDDYWINIVVNNKKYQFHVREFMDIYNSTPPKQYTECLAISAAVIIVIDVASITESVGDQFDFYYQLIQMDHPDPCDICVIINRLDYLKKEDTKTLNEIKTLIIRLDELKIMHFETSLKFIQVHPLQNYLEHLVDIGYGKLIP